MDCSSLGSSVHGISQARRLEWVAIPFSRDLPDPGIVLASLGLLMQAESLPGATWEVQYVCVCVCVYMYFIWYAMEDYPTIKNLEEQSPTFLAPGTNFMGDSFSTDWRWGGCFGDDSSALHLLCTLCLLLFHQLHLRSLGIRSWRLGTPDLGNTIIREVR